MKFARGMALSVLGLLLIGAFAGEWLFGIDSTGQDMNAILLSPGLRHFFGTDSLGRDLFVRVLVGAKASLFVALFSSGLAMILGISLGAVAGWRGGRADSFLIRSMDILQSVPSFLLVSLLCLLFQSLTPLLSVALSIGLIHWFNVAKMTRSLTKQIKTMPYVEAAQALGARPGWIFLNHILPNMRSSLLISFGFLIPNCILYESMISFAGFGLQAPDVSWGILLQEGWRSLSQFPHLLLLPAGVLFITVLSCHLLIGKSRKLRG